MNKLRSEEKVRVVACLVEGNSLRATVRMTGIHRTTIQNLLVELGAACSAYQDKVFRNLKCKRLQCDEIWSFCYAKQKNVPEQFKGEFGYGDVWTWTAIEAQTKLVPCSYVGRRDASAAYHFIHDLAGRLATRVQLTTDGLRTYVEAVEDAFGADIDYAMLVKIYGNEQPVGEARYSPAVCMGTRRAVIAGRPDYAHVSTSFSERQNLTMRMQMRRFTRLTNGFSKKVQNLEAAVALHFMHYNFARVHQTLRVVRGNRCPSGLKLYHYRAATELETPYVVCYNAPLGSKVFEDACGAWRGFAGCQLVTEPGEVLKPRLVINWLGLDDAGQPGHRSTLSRNDHFFSLLGQVDQSQQVTRLYLFDGRSHIWI